MHEALFYKKLKDGKVQCELCPHNCIIKEGKPGICKVRINRGGKLMTLVYNQVAAIHSDPIEKKPLYHFYPGKNILSIGGTGCNFRCDFCQNYSISQCHPGDFSDFTKITPAQVVEHAKNITGNLGIAYTYNEPVTFYEFMYDCSVAARQAGLKNTVVSNGFINPDPLKKLLPTIDAFNIDLKAFNDSFYRTYSGVKLQPVLDTLKTISKAGKHLEITFLLITEANDNPEEFENMVRWISDELGKNTPLHISRYFPAYKMKNPPTPVELLEKFYDIASRFLNYVFLGNVADDKRSDTCCPACGTLLIQRNYYRIRVNNQFNDSRCYNCSAETGIIL